MKNILVLLACLTVGTSASAQSLTSQKCQSADKTIVVTMTSAWRNGSDFSTADHASELSVKGQALPALKVKGKDFNCRLTLISNGVLRCPHKVSAGQNAEVYPKFRGGKLVKVSILGAFNAELTDCTSTPNDQVATK